MLKVLVVNNCLPLINIILYIFYNKDTWYLRLESDGKQDVCPLVIL